MTTEIILLLSLVTLSEGTISLGVGGSGEGDGKGDGHSQPEVFVLVKKCVTEHDTVSTLLQLHLK